MKYRAITSENFYYLEMKNAGRVLQNNLQMENIKEEFRKRDTLDCNSENNFNKKFLSISKRMGYLSDTLKENLINGDSAVGKFIVLYSILCAERFLFDFANEVLKEKFRVFDYYLKDIEIIQFMNLKSDENEIVKNWSDSGKKKMISKIKTFFSEGGFLSKDEDKLFRISRPIVLPEIIDEMKNNGNVDVVKAMLY